MTLSCGIFKMYKKFGKRTIDLIISLLGLILVSPILLICSLAVLLNYGSPIFFSQLRPGLRNKVFMLHKLRTMTQVKDDSGKYLPDLDRITRVGTFLRNTSLDELPSLLNVLKGDMSLVGPRPLLVEYLPLYSKEQLRRHEVKPGITGWAQVHGRNTISWEEKFTLDVWYIDNQSFFLDLKIIVTTIMTVLRKKDINHDDEVTMPVFKGK
jgi:lipopolysaccharide/colanic/teichoic acid biosynthesis glycosyltransferase